MVNRAAGLPGSSFPPCSELCPYTAFLARCTSSAERDPWSSLPQICVLYGEGTKVNEKHRSLSLCLEKSCFSFTEKYLPDHKIKIIDKKISDVRLKCILFQSKFEILNSILTVLLTPPPYMQSCYKVENSERNTNKGKMSEHWIHGEILTSHDLYLSPVLFHSLTLSGSLRISRVCSRMSPNIIIPPPLRVLVRSRYRPWKSGFQEDPSRTRNCLPTRESMIFNLKATK